MADCLKSNLSVQEPVYCEDASGNIIPDTAMYSWMAVRAAGPNVLKDTTLCGKTTILDQDVVLPIQSYYQMYLIGNQAGGELMATTAGAINEWVPFGNLNYPTRIWTVKYEMTETNEALQILDIPPQPFAPGAIGVTNTSTRDIVARITLTCSVQVLGVTGTVFASVGLWQSEVSATPLPSDATIQTVLMGGGADDHDYTCDFFAILKPNEVIQPVLRYSSGTVTSFNIVECNLVAQFIEYYSNTGGDDVLPGGTIPPA